MRRFKFGPHTITSNEIFFNSKHSFGLVNLKPIVPGHVLVISRRVSPRFLDLSNEEAADLMESAHIICRQIEKVYKSQSLTLTIQDGLQAGQSVPHTHLHIIPRYEGDWMNNDDIYPALQAKEKEMADGLSEEKRKGPDSNRPPRSSEEMKKEAEELRGLFSNYEEIWQ
jgi:bis(5'-adenosyl)-triphosphatase